MIKSKPWMAILRPANHTHAQHNRMRYVAAEESFCCEVRPSSTITSLFSCPSIRWRRKRKRERWRRRRKEEDKEGGSSETVVGRIVVLWLFLVQGKVKRRRGGSLNLSFHHRNMKLFLNNFGSDSWPIKTTNDHSVSPDNNFSHLHPCRRGRGPWCATTTAADALHWQRVLPSLVAVLVGQFQRLFQKQLWKNLPHDRHRMQGSGGSTHARRAQHYGRPWHFTPVR